MREPARLQAAIDILDLVIAAARDGGPAADTLVQRYFATRRYAGAKDRAAIRDLVFEAIRFTGERPPSGRAALLGLAETRRADLLPLFDGSRHAPAPPAASEPRAAPSPYPGWLHPALCDRFGDRLEAETAALIARAPLDLRLNPLRADPLRLRAELQTDLGAQPIPGLPLACRLPESRALDHHPRFLDGGFEIQDAGSQRVVALATARPGETVIDLCAGAGGKTLALAADMALSGRLIATDTDRARLATIAPRLARAGAAGFVETRLLDAGREAAALADLEAGADLVLVDAPCSGSGTWRRSPELRWRLTPERLDRLLAVQARLMTLAAGLVKPGGRIVYAVCSVLPAEGEAALATRSPALSLTSVTQLSPATDGCDGFFIARLDCAC